MYWMHNTDTLSDKTISIQNPYLDSDAYARKYFVITFKNSCLLLYVYLYRTSCLDVQRTLTNKSYINN